MMPRPALRYHGGKFRLAPWNLSHFPTHNHYVEVFGGGASVLLCKPPSKIETYNDIDHAVVTFFRVLRECPNELIRVLELTPWSREELKLSRRPADDELETARRLFVGAWQGRGKATAQWSTGWRYEVLPIRGVRAYADAIEATANLRLVAERLRRVQIECDDWRNVLARYDSPATLFYLDPPYLASVRSDRWHNKAYRHEMTDGDHRDLSGLLAGIEGMAVVSGYPSMLYDELYAGWVRFMKRTQADIGATVECLWVSPSASAQAKQAAMFTNLPLAES